MKCQNNMKLPATASNTLTQYELKIIISICQLLLLVSCLYSSVLFSSRKVGFAINPFGVIGTFWYWKRNMDGYTGITLSICLSFCLFFCLLSVRLSVYLSVCLCVSRRHGFFGFPTLIWFCLLLLTPNFGSTFFVFIYRGMDSHIGFSFSGISTLNFSNTLRVTMRRNLLFTLGKDVRFKMTA